MVRTKFPWESPVTNNIVAPPHFVEKMDYDNFLLSNPVGSILFCTRAFLAALPDGIALVPCNPMSVKGADGVVTQTPQRYKDGGPLDGQLIPGNHWLVQLCEKPKAPEIETVKVEAT